MTVIFLVDVIIVGDFGTHNPKVDLSIVCNKWMCVNSVRSNCKSALVIFP